LKYTQPNCKLELLPFRSSSSHYPHRSNESAGTFRLVIHNMTPSIYTHANAHTHTHAHAQRCECFLGLVPNNFAGSKGQVAHANVLTSKLRNF